MAASTNPYVDEILQRIAQLVGGVAAPAQAAAPSQAAAPTQAAAPARLAPGTDFLRELFQRSHGGMLPEQYEQALAAGVAPQVTRISPRRQKQIFAERLRDYIAAGAPKISEEFAWRVRNQDPEMLAFIEEVRRRGG